LNAGCLKMLAILGPLLHSDVANTAHVRPTG
jgi:hypothetical protein